MTRIHAAACADFKPKSKIREEHAAAWLIHAAACHGGAKIVILGHAATCLIHAAAWRQYSAGLFLASRVKDSYVILLSFYIDKRSRVTIEVLKH